MRVQELMLEIYIICKDIEKELDELDKLDAPSIDDIKSEHLYNCYLLLDKIRERC